MRDIKVAEIMTTEITTVRDDMTVADAVVTLADAHVSGVPVLNAKLKFVGVLSTTDVLDAASEAEDAAAREALFANTLVRDIMTPRPKTIAPDDRVKDAAQQMLYLEVHRLFVEYEGELAGVISQSDIVRAVATATI